MLAVKTDSTIPAFVKKFMTWEDAVLWLRNQPEHAQLVNDCFYDDIVSAAAERYHRSTEWNAVRELLPAKKGMVLDVGAGRGISSYAFASDGWNVTALEPDRSDIVGSGAIRRLAEDTGINLTVVEVSGDELPFEKENFDLVYCRAVLHHAQDLNRFCAEMSRVLKKDGTFIATREHVISSQKDLEAFLQSHPLHRLYGGENAYCLDEYKKAFRNAGINIVSVFNPCESDINLFPSTKDELRRRISGKLKWPLPGLVPDIFLKFLGFIDRTPGRLYSFKGEKSV